MCYGVAFLPRMLDTHAREIVAKIGDFVKRHREHLWTGLLLALVAWSAYNLGLVRGHRGAAPLQEAAVFRPREGIVSPTGAPARQGRGAAAADKSDQRVVVSKSSDSKKYHHAWCPGATQIKEANRVWFPTADDAKAAGYTLAGNCTE